MPRYIQNVNTKILRYLLIYLTLSHIRGGSGVTGPVDLGAHRARANLGRAKEGHKGCKRCGHKPGSEPKRSSSHYYLTYNCMLWGYIRITFMGLLSLVKP